jgi:CubicO group peptidase (beta-lactamase class C family)
MMRTSTWLLLVAVFLASPFSASARDPLVIPKVVSAMQEAIAKQELAGVITIVADKDRILHRDVQGLADIENKVPLADNTLFWIASMSKPITGVAVMMMVEQGKISLDDPVEKYLPEFKNLKNKEGEHVPVTVAQLLTHTSGLAEITADQAKASKTLADVIPLYVAQPVKFPPGSQWVYCQSGINTAARIVEVVSGEKFPEFLDKHLFQPLGMTDTTFYLSEDQNKRLSKTYKRTDEGKLEVGVNQILNGRSPTDRDRFPAANGGLFSTAGDYLKFCQMLLNNGEFNGKRVLKADTVRTFRTVHSGDLKTGFTPGNGWGVGCCVIREPQGPTAALSTGSFGHGGAHGTQAWIDPTHNRIYLLMIQRTNIGNSDAGDLRKTFQDEAAAALNKTPAQ